MALWEFRNGFCQRSLSVSVTLSLQEAPEVEFPERMETNPSRIWTFSITNNIPPVSRGPLSKISPSPCALDSSHLRLFPSPGSPLPQQPLSPLSPSLSAFKHAQAHLPSPSPYLLTYYPQSILFLIAKIHQSILHLLTPSTHLPLSLEPNLLNSCNHQSTKKGSQKINNAFAKS